MMTLAKLAGALAGSAALALTLLPLSAQEAEPGFKSLFNGKDLSGWAGRPQHWSVEDGAITGTTTKENPAQGNNFLIAKDSERNLIVDDFELRFSYKFTGPWGNSGCQDPEQRPRQLCRAWLPGRLRGRPDLFRHPL